MHSNCPMAVSSSKYTTYLTYLDADPAYVNAYPNIIYEIWFF